MKKREAYLAWSLLLGILVWASIFLSKKEEARSIDLNWIFYKKKTDPLKKSQLDEIPPENDTLLELKTIGNFINDANSLFHHTDIPKNFIRMVKEKNTKTWIRNGNLDEAEKLDREYQHKLTHFIHLCDSLDLPMDISKKECYRRWESLAQHPKGKGKVWHIFFQQRLRLGRAFKAYRKKLALILSTEQVIWEQKNHFPELYAHMNSLYNFDGSRLAIYVISYPKVIAGHGQPVSGLAIFGKYKGLLTSSSPELNASYPDLICKKHALTVHLKKGVAGKVLSHEFGHLYYLYYHWNDYLDYIQSRPGDYEFGGHGITDPSGQAAELAEKGIFPQR